MPKRDRHALKRVSSAHVQQYGVADLCRATADDAYFPRVGTWTSVVKHAQSASVRELIQKIENHPDRHALQQDLRQNQAKKPI